MEDIISKYKKQKRMKTFWIIAASFILAISANIYMSTSNIWKSIKSSVLENTVSSKKSDLYLINNQNIVTLQSSKKINQVKNISFSFLYNPENVDLKDTLKYSYDFEIINISDEEWQYTISLNFTTPVDINAWEDILWLVIDKKDNTKNENINLAQANFIDFEGNSFSLTTSWISY